MSSIGENFLHLAMGSVRRCRRPVRNIGMLHISQSLRIRDTYLMAGFQLRLVATCS